MTYNGRGRFSGRGGNSAALPVNPQIDLCRDATIDVQANAPESMDETFLVVPCRSVQPPIGRVCS